MTDRIGWRLASALAVLAVALCPAAAFAEELFGRTIIDDEALRDFTGAALINQSAGDGNLQSNTAFIATNAEAQARVRISTVQLSAATPDETVLDAFALIEGDAFADAQGVLLVTQGAGRNNLQINHLAAALGLEGEVLVESELSQSRANALSPLAEEREGNRLAHVGPGAFRDAGGVIQVNQVAGQENATFNRFVLGVSSNALP
ncbi:hypothetical protein [Pelagibius sp.]|uniref:hypothetical protein n=1 Tax=Pelagibius sp. TaxID=1931238 RepID=UPI002623113E|nr:hypothetical protein [Pelagibius sp.]